MNPRSAAKTLGASLFLVGLCVADPAASTSLGLPRLQDETADGSAPVARSKVTEDDLTVRNVAGARSGEKLGAKFLAFDAAAVWSRPLRGNLGDTLFVSFSLYASTGTILEIAGARLGVVASDIDQYAQLAVDEASSTGPKWRLLGVHVPLEKHEDHLLGSISILTVRLDPANGTWDLYLGARLVAEDLPLDPSTKHAQFILHAGAAGAMINGLVQADENPLYEDANANGIDDRFEQTNKGRLLASDATKADRKELIQQWRLAQRSEHPPALFFNRPLPDGN